MPRIFDNIDLQLFPILRETLLVSYRADFCVGYFNLRGWRKIDDLIEQYVGGVDAEKTSCDRYLSCCRLLIGMQTLPRDEVHAGFTLSTSDGRIDNSAIIRLKKLMAAEFSQQLTIGAPTNNDEAGLRRLSNQLKTGKVIIKLFLQHPLHAKLYLVHRHDPNSPIVGFLGSSNLTLAGLRKQGELNIDVLDHDACNKLQKWFDDRWKEYGCIDISRELAEIIDNSWAREELILPYHIYLKIAYHLSHEAIAGLSEFRIPREFNNLFDFQKAAVQLAARHVTRRGGVLVGDVVGLGKTLVGTALAKILQEDCLVETLIICPKNLVKMWQEYVDNYRLYAKVVPISKVQNQLPDLRRYRIVLIDESHNLRNREGKRYRAIAEYIAANESKCILLSATPYNKTYLDLSAQLRLFVPEDQDLGLRPEALLNELGGETEFIRRHQCSIRSLAAFEKSEHPDDWRELMKRYMVRRTRSFIKDNYAHTDDTGRKYLEFPDGRRSYFPDRIPRTVKFTLEASHTDIYSRLYSESVVEVINQLNLPRYGLGNYIATKHKQPPTEAEQRQLNRLFRGGRRLMGFSQTSIDKLFGLSNERFIFEGVDHRFKFSLLTFEKGGLTNSFRSAFRINPREAIKVNQLETFFKNKDEQVQISVPLIRRLSPDSLSVMEFKNELDIHIAEKMLKFPLLGEKFEGKWNLRLTREFDMTNDSYFFNQRSGTGKLPLYEGKMIHQFTHLYAEPRYWVDEQEARKAFLGKNESDQAQILDYQCYRLCFRAVASSTNERALITSIIPKFVFCGNSLLVSLRHLEDNQININHAETLFITTIFNSFVIDYCLRQKVTTNLNMFYIYQLPIPRLTEGDQYFNDIVQRAAKLICTTPEFDELAQEVGLGSHLQGVTDEVERVKLRAELDSMIAHIYGLTEEEFTYILSTFPIVPESVKTATLEAYHLFAPTPQDEETALLIQQSESAELDFKSSAWWDIPQNKKEKFNKRISETVAAFLNVEKGGTLLIGVADDGSVVGIEYDYNKKFDNRKNRDVYENNLMTSLLNACGQECGTCIQISFCQVEGKDLCRITVLPSPRPVYIKNGQDESFYIRTGNSNRLFNVREANNYIKSRWD